MRKIKHPRYMPARFMREQTEASSVMFGLILVIAIIAIGAALFGGSMSRLGERWGSTVDSIARGVGLAVTRIDVYNLESDPELDRQIRLAAMIAPGENMLRADPQRIKERLEATGRVSNVRVYRFWPDTLVIHAHPATETALWNHEGAHYLVDNHGRLMRPAQGRRIGPEEQAGLLHIRGEKAFEGVPALVEGLEEVPQLRKHIKAAHRIGARRWTLELVSGQYVLLPADTKLPGRLSRFVALNEAARLTDRPLNLIDLRIAGKVYLQKDSAELEGGV